MPHEQLTPRPLHVIAAEIRADWKRIHYAAQPYLNAMAQLDSIDGADGADSAKSIVLYFLSNSATWRGPAAKLLKSELKAMLK